MKITIEDDEGRRLALETALAIIPPGHAVLVCPVDKETFIPDTHKMLIERQIEAWGIRALVTQVPIHVWAVATDAWHVVEDKDAQRAMEGGNG